MVRRLCDPADARRMLNPGPVAIVTAAWRDLVGATPIAWTTPLSIEPPLIGVAIRWDRHIGDLVRSAGEFAVNIPGPAMLKQTAYLGSVTGAEHQKIEEAQLDTFRALRVEAPLLDGCLAWIECDVEDVRPYGDHMFFVGEVRKVQALDEAYVQYWKLEDPRYSPLCYLGGTQYATLASPREAEFEVDQQGVLVLETAEERERREEMEAMEAERLLHDPEAPAG